MYSTDIIGYIADASIICPNCVEVLYPAHCSACGAEGKNKHLWHDYPDCAERYVAGFRPDPDLAVAHKGKPGYGAFVAIDHEGNPVGVIFAENSGEFEGEHCSECGELIAPYTCERCGRDLDEESPLCDECRDIYEGVL